MKIRGTLEVVAANAVLLLLLYFVTADEAGRAEYAAKEGLTFLLSRSVLVQSSLLQGSGGALQSPLTLDWVQLLLGVLVIVDGLFAYGAIKRGRKAATPRPETSFP